MKSIKSTLYLGAIASMALTFAPQAYADSGMHKSMAQHGQASAEHKDIMGSGVVHSVDIESRKINISHDPIPALKWPEMTMDLDVSEGVDLEALSPDDAIQFHIELGGDKGYRITKIMKADVAHHEGQQCEAGMDCPMHEDMKHGAE